ncbi:MAG: mandelate racemase/muconate lactonizing enzyme family protein [Acetobacteraceae bacterium]
MRTAVVHVPLAAPARAAIFEVRAVDCVLVFLDTDDGLVGEGLVMTVNGRRLAVLHEMVRSLAPLVVGMDLRRVGSLAGRVRAELNFYGEAGVSMMGLAGVDMALFDLRAKFAELNVAAMLGACRETVPAYASGGLWLSHSVDALQEEAASFLSRGFRAMKLRLGMPDPAEDVARVRAVREVVGPAVALMADANQQMTVPQAIRLGRMLEEFGLTWFEEPVHYQNHDGEAAIAAALDTPLASGESEYTARGMLTMLQRRSADILMPDLQRMGGPTEFLKAAHVADVFDVPVSSHLYTEMSLPLLATLPNAIFLEHMPWFEPLYVEQVELNEAGDAIVPEQPGWGFTLNQEAIARFAAP